MIGWAAARGELSQGAWVLFAIVFLWQLPHFLAIAWIYRDDYARAGFAMLPVIEPDGRSTARQAVFYCAALLPVSLAPTLLGLANTAYFVAALGIGLLFLGLTLRFARTRSIPRRAPAVLRLDHLSAAALDPDDRRPGVTLSDLPALNASLNATAAVLLVIGYSFIRNGQIRQHRAVMISACTVSTLFLISYVVYHANIGSKPFQRHGPIRVVYFTILLTHVVLAAAVVPLALITLTRGLRGRFDRHVRDRALDVPDLAVRVGHRRDRVCDALSAVE